MGSLRARSRASRSLAALVASSLVAALCFGCAGKVREQQPASGSGAGGSAAGNASGSSAAGNASGGSGAEAAGASSTVAAGASSTAPRPCTSDADCPSSGECQPCADGSKVCPLFRCNGEFCVDNTPTCNCPPTAQLDGGPGDGSRGYRCTWGDCGGISCPTGTACTCCGGFGLGCICSTNCQTNADCPDPRRPVCDLGVCSDGAYLCCICK